ncbi:hypothetical protein CWC46_12565 [Prodigiosinella confusarubida]|uniref:Uncharacterized protein n=1 Tax=Serratia sp. (strain ATCC 39006) TaxID=104623 RepID=A0A2I5TK05_SERS3|nr:hypothetical protein [Serratia sp. ATCC 39006]AUH00570.1 hypothetical protein CWC46_12565 [Serratia sp. ATCC 39006]AUH04891.1 hypothetical protein Ser39006_012570 [Serratia sp. ATCC 39006]
MKKVHLVPTNSSERICIDYTAYLGALCNKRWRFIDAIYGVMPIFGIVTKMPEREPATENEKLETLALQVLSTQVSDETNIARLITLAQQQGLTDIDIRLPYALSMEQLQAIGQECDNCLLALTQYEEYLSIHITVPMPGNAP